MKIKAFGFFCCATLALGLLAGCGEKKQEISTAEFGDDVPLPNRIEAAAKLPSEQRDEMLRRFAQEAIMKRQPDLAMQAIDKLENQQSRDDVAAGIAKLCARMGDTTTAAQFIDKISSPEQKANTLNSIGGR